MRRKIKKTILISIAILTVTGVCTGLYLYNKKPIDVRTAWGIKVNATGLYHTYSTDSTTANEKYTGKVVEVKGEVISVSSNVQQQKIILIKTGSEGAYVNCTMEGATGEVQPSQIISLKGIVTGIGQGEPDLGILGDVYLVRSYNTGIK